MLIPQENCFLSLCLYYLCAKIFWVRRRSLFLVLFPNTHLALSCLSSHGFLSFDSIRLIPDSAKTPDSADPQYLILWGVASDLN